MKLTIFALILMLAATAGLYAADVSNGRTVYTRACVSCHSIDGSANPNIMQLRNAQMRDLSSKEVQARSDADLKSIILNGTGKMPNIARVEGTALDDVIAFVRSIKK